MTRCTLLVCMVYSGSHYQSQTENMLCYSKARLIYGCALLNVYIYIYMCVCVCVNVCVHTHMHVYVSLCWYGLDVQWKMYTM